MRVVAQRVRSASVTVDGTIVGTIGHGLMLLVGVARDDAPDDVARVANKIAVMRIFNDNAGKMNLSCADAGGAMLAVSQFTLVGDLRRGRRPSFTNAAQPAVGRELYEHFVARLREHGYQVETGIFGADMLVSLENDGPVTIVLDSTEV